MIFMNILDLGFTLKCSKFLKGIEPNSLTKDTCLRPIVLGCNHFHIGIKSHNNHFFLIKGNRKEENMTKRPKIGCLANKTCLRNFKIYLKLSSLRRI